MIVNNMLVERTLALVTAEFITHPYSPELLAEFNQSFWNDRRQAMGLSQADLVVPQSPYTEEDIRKYAPKEFGLYVPPVISTAPEGLDLLVKGWPLMINNRSSISQAGVPIINVDKNGEPVVLFGWMTTEKTINAPYLHTNQVQVEAIADEAGWIGHTLNVYAVAGQQSKLLEREYLDGGKTFIRALSSRSKNQVLVVGFDPFFGYLVRRWGMG